MLSLCKVDVLCADWYSCRLSCECCAYAIFSQNVISHASYLSHVGYEFSCRRGMLMQSMHLHAECHFHADYAFHTDCRSHTDCHSCRLSFSNRLSFSHRLSFAHRLSFSNRPSIQYERLLSLLVIESPNGTIFAPSFVTFSFACLRKQRCITCCELSLVYHGLATRPSNCLSNQQSYHLL